MCFPPGCCSRGWSARHPAPAVRLGPVEIWTYGYNAILATITRIAPFGGLVVMALDLAEVSRLSEARVGVEVAGVGPQMRVIRQPPQVAVEHLVIDGVESRQG